MRKKPALRLLGLIGLLICIGLNALVIGRAEPGGWGKLERRLINNDESAFVEAAGFPIAGIGPLLLSLVEDRAVESRASRASEALRTMPGFTQYMKGRLLEKRSRAGGEFEMTEFQMLAAIGGKEAEAAIAPFLFVDDVPIFTGSDYSAGPINHMAMATLISMDLPDAPAKRVYEGFSRTNLEDWKAWAVRKGYKDESIKPVVTLKEKGVDPATAAKSEAQWKSILEFIKANAPKELKKALDAPPRAK